MQLRDEHGYSLTEILTVVGLLGLIAAVAAPGNSSNDELKLERAATGVAAALRFARSEALRTGEGHGLTINRGTQVVTVRNYDLTTTPISALETLRHPISKQPYQFNVKNDPGTSGVKINNTDDVFTYEIKGRQESLIFDASGTPIFMTAADPNAYPLVQGAIELQLKNSNRFVFVAPMTGRVTVQ